MEDNFNLDQIIENYSNYVFKIIDNIITSSLPYQEKEDAVADTFYLLWKNHDKITTDMPNYLKTIARNVAYQKLRDKNNDFAFDENFIITKYNLEDSLIIEELLKNLTEKEKDIFDLYYLKGYKIREIAQLKHQSLSSIKMTLNRMRKKIKEASLK